MQGSFPCGRDGSVLFGFYVSASKASIGEVSLDNVRVTRLSAEDLESDWQDFPFRALPVFYGQL